MLTTMSMLDAVEQTEAAVPRRWQTPTRSDLWHAWLFGLTALSLLVTPIYGLVVAVGALT
jgi:hypothetical protein